MLMARRQVENQNMMRMHKGEAHRENHCVNPICRRVLGRVETIKLRTVSSGFYATHATTPHIGSPRTLDFQLPDNMLPHHAGGIYACFCKPCIIHFVETFLPTSKEKFILRTETAK